MRSGDHVRALTWICMDVHLGAGKKKYWVLLHGRFVHGGLHGGDPQRVPHRANKEAPPRNTAL